MMSYVGEIAVLVIFLIGCVAAVSLLQYLARRFTEEEERPKFKVARGRPWAPLSRLSGTWTGRPGARCRPEDHPAWGALAASLGRK